MRGDASPGFPGWLGLYGLLGLFGLGLGLMLLGGCATRPTHRIDASRAVVPRDGWVRLGPDVRLRGDTPPLAEVQPPDAPAPASGDFGPRGTSGASSSYADAGGYGYGYGFGYGYTPFLAPGGAVPPDLRVPTDARPVSPYAAPYRAAFPGADVTAHRPGLSTGSGVWGRQDDTRPPLPLPLPLPPPPRR